MKEFIQRAVLFAVINALIIGICFAINPHAKMPDYNIIYGTLTSILLSFPYEIYMASKIGRRPNVETFGASIFGAIVMAGLLFVILYIAGVIV